MSAKFTPGPWIASKSPTFNGVKTLWEIHWSEHGECVAEVVHGEPDAKLIAASPDLYAVCKEIREAFSYFSEWDLPIGFEDRLNQALAKAEGGS